ncbi:MAG TPA: NAD(+)/NADH kinase [Planctomycetota bacterium]|nr:NAD(+)/NADH kinase [Planctomycetota bacterium]
MSRLALQKVLCLATSDSPAAVEAAMKLRRELLDAGFEAAGSAEDGAVAGAGLVILLGGDGFLMESVRLLGYTPTPIFGVNFGTVGFLMNTKECLHNLVSMVKGWSFREEQHPLLEARAVLEDGGERRMLAFNDFVVERMMRQGLRLDVYLDDVPFNSFAGDGFVVSAAAGSTAYNLAARGPVVHPAVKVLIVTPLYPHRAAPFHSLQFSLLVPLESRLRIHALDLPKRGMRVVGDGEAVDRVRSVEVADSGRTVNLLRPLDHHFVKTLSRKFMGVPTEFYGRGG